MSTAAATALALVLTACSHPKPLIYVIPRTTATLFWESLHTGALVAAQATGYRIYWNAATREDDVERQIELVQQAGRRRPAGLVLAPDHSSALLTQVRLLVHSDMPVVVVDSRLGLPAGPNLTYIVSDHAQAGRQAADRIAAVSPQARVVLLGLNPDLSGDLETAAAFEQQLERAAPKASLIAKRFSRFNRQETESQMEAIMSAERPPDFVFALSSQSLLGALDAVQRRPSSHAIRLIGCDQDMDLVQPLRRDQIDSIVLQDTYQEGLLAVQAIAQRRATGHWPPPVVTPTRLVTRNDLEDPSVLQRLTMSPER